MVYYFKRFKVTWLNTVFAFLNGCAITGLIQKFIIQYHVKGAGAFDIYLVNELRCTPSLLAFAFFFLLIAAGIAYGIRFANKRKLHYLKLGLWRQRLYAARLFNLPHHHDSVEREPQR